MPNISSWSPSRFDAFCHCHWMAQADETSAHVHWSYFMQAPRHAEKIIHWAVHVNLRAQSKFTEQPCTKHLFFASKLFKVHKILIQLLLFSFSASAEKAILSTLCMLSSCTPTDPCDDFVLPLATHQHLQHEHHSKMHQLISYRVLRTSQINQSHTRREASKSLMWHCFLHLQHRRGCSAEQ